MLAVAAVKASFSSVAIALATIAAATQCQTKGASLEQRLFVAESFQGAQSPIV